MTLEEVLAKLAVAEVNITSNYRDAVWEEESRIEDVRDDVLLALDGVRTALGDYDLVEAKKSLAEAIDAEMQGKVFAGEAELDAIAELVDTWAAIIGDDPELIPEHIKSQGHPKLPL